MFNFSVKAKILVVILTLSVVTLAVFGFLSFQTYKKDKIAFVYDYFTSEIRSNAMVFTGAMEAQEFLLGTIITSIDVNSKNLPSSTLKYLQKTPRISGIHLHAPQKEDLGRITLFEAENKSQDLDWNNLDQMDEGLSLIDEQKGLFYYKKKLPEEGSYALISFYNRELSKLLHNFDGRFSFLFNGQSGEKKSEAPVSPEELQQILGRVKQVKVPFGLFEINLAQGPHFVTFSRLASTDLMLVSVVRESKILLVQEVFLRQLVLFLVLMISVSLIIGTVSASWLIRKLENLSYAANEMENENFEVQVKITGRDEFTKVGNAFNSMSQKIKVLLEELRIHNLELEQKVAERTAELQNISNIQRAMVNSLGQGFVIVNKDYQILPIYSKVAQEMFEAVPDQVGPAEIMRSSAEDAKSHKDLFDLMVNKALDFDDMVQFYPDSLTNSKQQKIQLNYAPILKDEGDEVDYMLVIGTDKTAEIESMEKFQNEWKFSQMILKMASNRFSLIKLIKESLQMLSTSASLIESSVPFAARDVQRYVHTIKGGLSFYYLSEVTEQCHELETYLSEYFEQEQCPEDIKQNVLGKILSIQIAIENYIDKFENILKFKGADGSLQIELKELKHFEQMLKQEAPQLAQTFAEKFYVTPVRPYFEVYPTLVKELGIKLQKDVTFRLIGGDTTVPEGPMWDELFQQFVHVVRNSMDHGIETPEVRRSIGKPETGTIEFKFERVKANGYEFLKIILTDDGQGINWRQIAKKDPEVTSEKEAIQKILLGGISSKEEVSEVSGRGVGVSALFACVKKYNGRFKITNRTNKGIEIELTIPFSSATSAKAA